MKKTIHGTAILALVLLVTGAAGRDTSVIVIGGPEDTEIVWQGGSVDSAAPDAAPTRGRRAERTGAPSAHFGFGLNTYWFQYDEIIDKQDIRELLGVTDLRGEPKSSEHGFTPGFHAEAMLLGTRVPIGVRATVDLSLGLHTYEGSYQVPIPSSTDPSVPAGVEYVPATMQKRNVFVAFSGALTAAPTVGPLRLIPALGVERRIWLRSLDQGISETYRWLWALHGLEVHFLATPRFSIGPAFAWRWMLDGTMELHYDSDYSSGFDIEAPPVQLDNRPGIRGSIAAEYRFAGPAAIRIEPWFEYYRFGRSNVDSITIDFGGLAAPERTPFYEPASATFAAGLNVTGLFLRVKNEER